MGQERRSIRASAPELEELYRSHYRLVRGFFRKRGLPDEDCRDLTQDTFLGAQRGVERYRGEANPTTWLLTIATNLWRNRVRDNTAAKRTAPVVALDGAPDGGEALLARCSLAEGAGDPLDGLIDTERRQLLRGAVEQLPPQMRRCFVLFVYQNRKYREIAELLGISIETVKSQIHQARDKLRQRVSGQNPDPAMTLGGEAP